MGVPRYLSRGVPEAFSWGRLKLIGTDVNNSRIDAKEIQAAELRADMG